MARNCNKKRRLFAGLLVFASTCEITTCSPTHDLTAVEYNGSSSSSSILHKEGSTTEEEEEEEEEARYDARNRQYMESVASVVRLLPSAANDNDAPKDKRDAKLYDEHSRRHGQDVASEKKRRRRQQQQKQHKSATQRDLIVGGRKAPPGRFPYVVSLQLEKVLDEAASVENNDGDEVSDVHTCGGTLIAMDVVLTAGHCGYEEHYHNYLDSTSSGSGHQGSVNAEGHVNFGEMPQQIFYGADVGAYNLTTDDASTYTNMLFEKLVIHPDYTGFHGKGNSRMSLQHDVMLVKLYGASEKPIVRLHNPKRSSYDPSHRVPTSGEDLVVVGWGDTDPASGEDNMNLANILQVASVEYVPNDICEDSKGYSNVQSNAESNNNMFFEDYFEYDGTISDDMMCAAGQTGGEDACQGDSGGGLIRLGESDNGDEDVQMGIVSWGLQCGDEDFPGVYARVGEHYDWIEQKVCALSDSPPSHFNCPQKPYPPGSVYDPVVDLTITIRFDDYRSETGWLLESIPDFRNIVFRPFGTYKSENTIDIYNTMSETVTVHSGRFYMLSILDEFADGFCCTVGEGFYRVESAVEEYPLIETTPGILWSPHALRRAFYVNPPGQTPPNYITITVTLGAGADPSKFHFVAIENVQYEALMLYEIRPFDIMNDSRAGGGSGAVVYSRTFEVPIFGIEFGRQRYNVMVFDENEGETSKASFEVYLGDAEPENLVIAQSGGNYGDKNYITRSFVLFKKQKETPSDSPAFVKPVDDRNNMASLRSKNSVGGMVSCLLFFLWLST